MTFEAMRLEVRSLTRGGRGHRYRTPAIDCKAIIDEWRVLPSEDSMMLSSRGSASLQPSTADRWKKRLVKSSKPHLRPNQHANLTSQNPSGSVSHPLGEWNWRSLSGHRSGRHLSSQDDRAGYERTVRDIEAFSLRGCPSLAGGSRADGNFHHGHYAGRNTLRSRVVTIR